MDQQRQSRWRPTRRQLLWAGGIVLAVIVSLAVVTVFFWLLWGVLEGYIAPKKPTEKKELVNIIVLIGAGIVGTLTAIAALGNLFVSRQNLQNARETLQVQRELDLARRVDEALQAHAEQLGDLLVDKSIHAKHNPFDETRVTARAQTLAVLPELDDAGKRRILQFLYEAQLINRWSKELGIDDASRSFLPRIVGLDGADLRNANLRYLTLEAAALNGAILENADLRDANLNGIDLGGAYLSGADLREAKLRGASLVRAQLQSKVELDLPGADLSEADLFEADLSEARLSGALLSEANLSSTKLRKADLHGADLGGSNMSSADLSYAILSEANLSEANGVTNEQLMATTSLEGATMPDGQILKSDDNPDGPTTFEEWLKSKGSGESEENNGPS